MYTLKKIELEDGKDSALPAGYSSTLPFLSLFDYVTERSKPISSIDEVEEGWQVVLTSLRDYHRTSKIRKIVSREDNKITFKTQTSIYELIQHNEDLQEE